MGRVRAVRALCVLALAVLSGCGSSQTSGPLACPRIISAPGADTIALFGPGGHDRKDVMVGGRFWSLSDSCEPLKVGFDVNAEISLYAERANPGITDATFPYFVALVSSDEKVLAQEQFTEKIDFIPAESYRRMPAAKITIHMPLLRKAEADSYTIIVGFQLTSDQIAFNRSLRPQ
ncbi:MAG TPA: hypothetical protein VL993_10485 [Stellaceae bacterium]|nr:hypothetical protein [Stellaceae bacterium]